MAIKHVINVALRLHGTPSVRLPGSGIPLVSATQKCLCGCKFLSGTAIGPNPENKALIYLTPAAATQLRNLSRSVNYKHIKIYTKKGGCAGDSYKMDCVSEPEKLDEVVEINGISIIIDRNALLKVIGCEIDYITTPVRSEFIFRNPNAKLVCGCGHSFKI